jgi:hypothetical protein
MSLIKIPIELRLESAARFYEYQVQKLDTPWHEILAEIETSNQFGIPEALVLLNPSFYKQLNATDPRGDRAFPSVPNSFTCRSTEVWGYKCSFQGGAIHVDHMFPHSKGGSTHPQNAMHLCAEHNMSKHTDIHLIPWENFPNNNSWIVNSVNHLLNFAQRVSSEKLYFPDKQLNRL